MKVDEIVAASIARARRNAENGFPIDHGADPDDTLRALGLPKRSATVEPIFLSVEFLRESGPRRIKRRRR